MTTVQDIISILKSDIEEHIAYKKCLAEMIKDDDLNFAHYRGEQLTCDALIQHDKWIIRRLEECIGQTHLEDDE